MRRRGYRRNPPLAFRAAGPGMGEVMGHFNAATLAMRGGDNKTAAKHLRAIYQSPNATAQQKQKAAQYMRTIASAVRAKQWGVRRLGQVPSGVAGDPYGWARNISWGGVGALPASFKALQKKFRDPGFTKEALAAARSGVLPRQIFRAIAALNDGQAKLMFPDYRTYRAFMSAMNSSRTFRRFKGRYARGRYRFAGKRRGYGRRRSSGRGRYRGLRRSRRASRRGYSRRGYRRGRGRSYGRRYSRRYRRNEGMDLYLENEGMDYVKAAGAAGVGFLGAVLLSALGRMAMPTNKYAGLIGGAVGAIAAFLLKGKIFDNDLFQKGLVAGAVAAPVWSGIAIARGTSGYGAYASTQPRYAMAGPMYQAAAGPFMQAAAGPFMQAAAGFGEYYAGDGSISPVSDFGEYVAQNLSVQGYGDYEVSPSFRGSSDTHGMGYVNDGVSPNSNLTQEFNLMEAAAGLGAVNTQSDYIPSGGALNVGSTEQSVDTGIFDVGGNNGVFG